MKRIITIQHCQSEHHVNKMVGGVTDWPLTELGLKQADNIGRALKQKLGDTSGYKMYSSDLKRASQTAEMVAKHLGLTPELHRELREINLGSATGKSGEWLNLNKTPCPEGVSWMYHRLLPDAETNAEMYERISGFVDMLEKSEDENIIVVAHGACLQMFAARWLKLSVKIMENTSIFGSSGGVSFMSERKDLVRVLNVWNDTSY
ncbi:MAG: phosphoglycerate mutase family protein, partial [Clostridia bacterium]|nr:phosphoglycerate mutase family protein [Clostridia bacterium]